MKKVFPLYVLADEVAILKLAVELLIIVTESLNIEPPFQVTFEAPFFSAVKLLLNVLP